MLILSRKVGERIVLDENILVTVLEVQGKRVRLGIEAPPDVNVRRHELQPLDRATATARRAELVGAH